jgi:hypothetical protein
MYRQIGQTSSIDESLFGGKESGSLTKGGRRTVTGPLAPTSVVISMEELNRIKVLKFIVFFLLIFIIFDFSFVFLFI